MTWIAPDAERSEGYPKRRNEPGREMLRDWTRPSPSASRPSRCAGCGSTSWSFLSRDMPEALIYYAGSNGGGGAAKQPFRNGVLMLRAKFPG